MICTKVLRSTPGKRVSTKVTKPLALSLSASTGYWVGYDVPRCLWLNSGWSRGFAALNWGNWVSNTAIWVAVEVCGAGWVLEGGKYRIGWVLEWWGCRTGEFGEVSVGCSGGWVRSWRTTLSIMSCSWAQRSSLIVEQLMEQSEDGVERCRELGVLRGHLSLRL